MMFNLNNPRVRGGLHTVLWIACGLATGCGASKKVTTGGDSPVTVQRLVGTRLTDIRFPVSWSFSDASVLIENDGEPLPADIIPDMLEDGASAKKIEANWQFDEQAGLLRLSGIKVDGEPYDQEVAVPVAPAGPVRMNLGPRQYNVFSNKSGM